MVSSPQMNFGAQSLKHIVKRMFSDVRPNWARIEKVQDLFCSAQPPPH